MVKAFGPYGQRYTPQYQLRELLLKGKVERIKGTLEKQKEQKNNGCSTIIHDYCLE